MIFQFLNPNFQKYELSLFVFFAILITIYGVSAQQESVCIKCHLEIDEENLKKPVQDFLKKENGKFTDVHKQAGLSCHHCHGGDPTNEELAKEKSKGFIGKPQIQDIPSLCSKCHSDIEYMRQFNPKLNTDQYQQYLTSIHGKKLQQGDKKVATCISCHGVHNIKNSKDPSSPVFPTNIPFTCSKCHSDSQYMKEYKIPTDQLEKYKNSKHGKMLLEHSDISAPRCNICHGNHGAVPPGVRAVHHICGNCHTQQEEYFVKSSHYKYFEERNEKGCATCHGYHEIPQPTDEMMSNKPGTICMKCHKENDRCFIATEKMKNAITLLEQKQKEAEQLLKKAEVLGMGVEKAKFNLQSVTDKLLMARIKIHQFNVDTVMEETNSGMKIVEDSIKKGNEALEEWQFRRKGLLVALGFIIFTIILLVLKIRSLNKK